MIGGGQRRRRSGLLAAILSCEYHRLRNGALRGVPSQSIDEMPFNKPDDRWIADPEDRGVPQA